MPVIDRATAALYGLAIGDALGMPLQLLSRERIAREFGPIESFNAARPDHPLAAGMPAGSVTDDTEQAVLVADLLVAGGGHIDARALADALLAWEDDMRARGSLDLLGPSTKAAVEAVRNGTAVEEAGRSGTTNGAAMRIAPVGVVASADSLGDLVDRVVEACLVSHNTGVAIAGAAAVAATVSVGVAGGTLDEGIEAGIAAARLGASRGNWVAGADVASRIDWVVRLARSGDLAATLDWIAALIGTSLATQESVPAAFGVLAAQPEDAWAACCAAASLGGDADTIAAMTGAMAGSYAGMIGLPAHAVATIMTVNDVDFAPLAASLVGLRGGGS